MEGQWVRGVSAPLESITFGEKRELLGRVSALAIQILWF